VTTIMNKSGGGGVPARSTLRPSSLPQAWLGAQGARLRRRFTTAVIAGDGQSIIGLSECNQSPAPSVCCSGSVIAAATEVIFMRPAAAHRSPNDPAFEQVYRSSYPALVGQLFLMTTNRAEAEDVVQEAAGND